MFQWQTGCDRVFTDRDEVQRVNEKVIKSQRRTNAAGLNDFSQWERVCSTVWILVTLQLHSLFGSLVEKHVKLQVDLMR